MKTKRNAKELCALLITRSLKDLDEDEEETVVDYLYDIGINVDSDVKPKELCLILLEKTMIADLGKKVPITAYANDIINKNKSFQEQSLIEKQKKSQLVEIENRRLKSQKLLEEAQRTLPGCEVNTGKLLSNTLYTLMVDEDLGIVDLGNNDSQYTAVISVSNNLYEKIFLELNDPIVEITTKEGFKGYARIGSSHDSIDNTIHISTLVATILNIKTNGFGFLKLCNSLPEISKVKFTYYGSKGELNNFLPILLERLPNVINAFSYLSLGMLLFTYIHNIKIQVRVDELIDSENRPIFAGIIRFSDSDLPFEIEADIK